MEKIPDFQRTAADCRIKRLKENYMEVKPQNKKSGGGVRKRKSCPYFDELDRVKVFIALKGSHFWFLFDFTAAGVVQCGGRKTSSRTSTIVQFIFYFGPLRSVIIFWEIKNKWLV